MVILKYSRKNTVHRITHNQGKQNHTKWIESKGIHIVVACPNTTANHTKWIERVEETRRAWSWSQEGITQSGLKDFLYRVKSMITLKIESHKVD